MDIHIIKQQGIFHLDIAFQSTQTGITALYGSSGSGKTSVVTMVAGLIKPDAGYIIVAGQHLFHAGKKIDVPPNKRKIGYVFQEGRLFPHFSVLSNLTYGMKRIPENQRIIKFNHVVDLLGIGALLDRKPKFLSGGEKQRVAMGRALLTSPSLLLMDEPLASLDSSRKQELLSFIKSINQELNITILYVSHALEEIKEIATKIVVLKEGRVVFNGAVEAVVNQLDTQVSVTQGILLQAKTAVECC